MSAQLSRYVAVYSRHFVASHINAPAVVVAVVFTLDHFVTTQRTMGWTKSLLDPSDDKIGCDARCTAERAATRRIYRVSGRLPHRDLDLLPDTCLLPQNYDTIRYEMILLILSI